jgi:amino acid transporter
MAAGKADEIVPKMDHSSDKSVSRSAADLEKQDAPQTDDLQRKLSSRHLQFVAIGESTFYRLSPCLV